MRKLALGLCLVLMIIGFPRELWAADALYRMSHTDITAFLAQNLVGWPGIITSFLLSLLGLIRNQPRWLVLGAIFALPISLYLMRLHGSSILWRYSLCSNSQPRISFIREKSRGSPGFF